VGGGYGNNTNIVPHSQIIKKKVGHEKKVLWLFVAFLALQLHAQQFPAIISIPVTFYDFHADKSNPEFEPDHNGGLYLGRCRTLG